MEQLKTILDFPFVILLTKVTGMNMTTYYVFVDHGPEMVS